MLITLDTVRADALGAYGQPLPTSPHIDALAAEGVLFEQCAASAPSTLPSHASIFTGQDSLSHGVRSNSGYVLPDSAVTLAEVLRASGFRTRAEVAAKVVARRTQLDQGFDVYRGVDSDGAELEQIRMRDGDAVVSKELPVRTGRDVTRAGIEFLRANREGRFFLWLHYFDAHDPHFPPPEFNARIPESPYHAEIASVDAEVGRIAEELARQGLDGETLVVLTSDHGEGLGEHSEPTHTFFVYETTIRVPLILWGLGDLPRGLRVSSLVRSVDIAPTILDLVGVAVPEAMQGVSLRPLLTGEADDLGVAAYGESIAFLKTFGLSPLRFVRRGDWKYIHKVAPELYDLASDPGETSDLASSRPDVVTDLRELLRARLEAGAAAGAAVSVDREAREELEALGYIAASAPAGAADRLERFEASGADPNEYLEDLELLNRARGWLETGRYTQALEMFEDLQARHPDSLPILRGRVRALESLGRRDELPPLLIRASELDTENRELALFHLADVLAETGRIDEVAPTLARALEADPCEQRVHAVATRLLSGETGCRGRAALLETSVARCSESAEHLNNYAWLLATCGDATVRDGARAVELAQRANAGRAEGNPFYLDTLAAAYAENGDFARALEASNRALGALESRSPPPPPEALALFREHTRELEAGRPLRSD